MQKPNIKGSFKVCKRESATNHEEAQSRVALKKSQENALKATEARTKTSDPHVAKKEHSKDAFVDFGSSEFSKMSRMLRPSSEDAKKKKSNEGLLKPVKYRKSDEVLKPVCPKVSDEEIKKGSPTRKKSSNSSRNKLSDLLARSTHPSPIDGRNSKKKSAMLPPSGLVKVKCCRTVAKSCTVCSPRRIPRPEMTDKALARRNNRLTREKLKEQDSVKSEHYTWTVVSLIAAGVYYDVYKVRKVMPEDDKKEFAMKAEMIEDQKRLKLELSVLKQCWEQENHDHRRHFLEFVDVGKTDKFIFVIVSLVGPTLEEIRRVHLEKNYSKTTALNASAQTLRAIADLHALGWLHRDIRPHNFAVGIGKSEDTIYILDFGIARRIFNEGTREIRKPRPSVKFLGAFRFAARACHYEREQGRKDDLESWLYMVFDLFDEEKGLPWKRSADKNEFLLSKEKFFRHEYERCYKIVPHEFKRLVDYINKLEYKDEPDYKYLELSLASIAKLNNIRQDVLPEWTGMLFREHKSRSDSSSDNRQSGSDDDDDYEGEKKMTKKQSSSLILKKKKKLPKKHDHP